MKLKDARQQAIALARTLDKDKVISIWRIRPREFEFAEGHVPMSYDLVMLVHAAWAQDGWYNKYHPEWVGDPAAPSSPACGECVGGCLNDKQPDDPCRFASTDNEIHLQDLPSGVYPVTYTTMAGSGGGSTTWHTYRTTLHITDSREPYVRLDNAERIATHIQLDTEPSPYLLGLSRQLATASHPAFEWPLFR